MAISVKTDIWRQSDLTRGVTYSRLDRAVRFCRVEQDPAAAAAGTELTLTEAIQACYEAFGATTEERNEHHEVDGLPLQTIRGYKFGPYKVLCVARYGYTYSGWGNAQPNINPFFAARNYSAYEPVRVYTSTQNASDQDAFYNGMPNGTFLGSVSDFYNPTKYPASLTWNRSVVKWIVSTRLSANPAVSVLHLKDRVNSEEVTLGGFPCAANTLRFDNYRATWINNVDTSLTWSVDYFFTWTDLWEHQVPWFDPSGTPSWDIAWRPTYEEAQFIGQFPIDVDGNLGP